MCLLRAAAEKIKFQLKSGPERLANAKKKKTFPNRFVGEMIQLNNLKAIKASAFTEVLVRFVTTTMDKTGAHTKR